MEEDGIQAQACNFPRIENGNGRNDSSKKMGSDINEENGELRRGGSGGGGGSDVSTNRLHSWWHHHSSQIIRVSRASGGEDRHSKIMTSKGLRDRRVRLSVTTAIQFYDLQDRLGYDQPSKTVEWLIKAASDAISELPSLTNTIPETPKQPDDEKKGSEKCFDSADAEGDGESSYHQQKQSQNMSLSISACSGTSETSKGSGLSLAAKEKEKEKENDESLSIAHHQNHHPLTSPTGLVHQKHHPTASPTGSYYTEGCPSKYGYFAVMGLVLCILFFSTGMVTVPWEVDSKIYPLRFRGVCEGIASAAVWISNLVVSQTFLSLTRAIGTSWTFLTFGFIAVLSVFFAVIFVPKTRGASIEEMEKMLEERDLYFRFWRRKKKEGNDEKDLARSLV